VLTCVITYLCELLSHLLLTTLFAWRFRRVTVKEHWRRTLSNSTIGGNKHVDWQTGRKTTHKDTNAQRRTAATSANDGDRRLLFA